MRSDELRKKFLDFFGRNGHTIVPSSSLIPDDPSVLLTTAGMQQFKPYYSELDPEMTIHPSIGKPIGKNAASVQKSFRTSDIDEVGDDSHLTFFEMLGNFSFGGYFKERTIELTHQFLVKELGLEISYVTVFEGKEDIGVPKDEESIAIWKRVAPGIEIKEQGMDDVFWGPTGLAGPCGPTTEIYIKNGAGEDIEVWNCVFNQYFYPGSREELNTGASGKSLEKLKTPGVDTGMGFERLAMIVQGKKNIFETDLFMPFLELLPAELPEREKRIIADHLRGAVFLLADGVRPSNKEAGAVLRRLLRTALGYEKTYQISTRIFDSMIYDVIHKYGKFYLELLKNREVIRNEIISERKTFEPVIESTGEIFIKRAKNIESKRKLIELFSELKKEKNEHLPSDELIRGQPIKYINYRDLIDAFTVSGKESFDLHQRTGAPLELIVQIARSYFNLEVDEKAFWEEIKSEEKKHQEISRAGQEKKFGGHGLLLDTGELKAADEKELKIVTRLHTATHMLQQALREVLGPDVHQAGSDITVERTRFDFTFSRKLTPEEIKKIEDLVNQKIKEDLPMQKKVMPKSEAEKTGALYFFKEKYPDPVNVYFIGKSLENAWSKEFCGGPHVTRTGEIGKFRIVKEEAVGAGVRRIRGRC